MMDEVRIYADEYGWTYEANGIHCLAWWETFAEVVEDLSSYDTFVELRNRCGRRFGETNEEQRGLDSEPTDFEPLPGITELSRVGGIKRALDDE